MNAPLDLAPYMVRPGNRVIVAQAESRRARMAYANAQAEHLRRCRAAFEGAGA
jgi:hypothetical protein